MPDGVVGVATAIDITQRRLVQGALVRRLELENALTDISRVMLALAPEDLENGIRLTLARFVSAAKAQCTFLLLLDGSQEGVAEEYRVNDESFSHAVVEGKTLGDYGIDRESLDRGNVLELTGGDGERAAHARCPEMGTAVCPQP